MKFKLHSDYTPNGDQPKAIKAILKNSSQQYQTLLGVTGSGKTFTMANVIASLQLPTLIMTHNKTLAAQLYSEFKGFFPQNHVEYFISYYDYYQPEAYIPRQDLYIEKDSSINEELERLRLSATSSLLEFDDVICIASVSANYGLGNPHEYKKMVLALELAQEISQTDLLLRLIDMGYKRNDNFFDRGNIRVNGDTVDIYLPYWDSEAVRVEFFDDEIEMISIFDVLSNKTKKSKSKIIIYSTSQFIVGGDKLKIAMKRIEDELAIRLKYFQENDMHVEYQRLRQKTEFDLEMMESTGVCKGIENYSRHLTDLKEGETPYTMFDYFEAMHDDYLVIVDESHVSLPQFRGMYAGDRARKTVLVDYGFRLPSALDNRPLKFDEFISKAPKYLFVSATPSQIELEYSKGCITEQVIRPTGLLDPVIEVKSSTYQVEDLHDEIKKVLLKKEKVLVTTLTKKMSEELTRYYNELGLRVEYMHSDLDSVQRNELIRGLRSDEFDVLIGINLLREGLDLPEVSLVAILDADKEGFLRSETALVQTIGRAARNSDSKVILYANKITKSMKAAIDITNSRRDVQDKYNKEHNITPKTVKRKLEDSLKIEDHSTLVKKNKEKMPLSQKKSMLKELEQKMKKYAKNLDFENAARLRDEILEIKNL